MARAHTLVVFLKNQRSQKRVELDVGLERELRKFKKQLLRHMNT